MWLRCDSCSTYVEVPDDYERDMCCNGTDCGCKGKPIDPLLCDFCAISVFGPFEEESK